VRSPLMPISSMPGAEPADPDFQQLQARSVHRSWAAPYATWRALPRHDRNRFHSGRRLAIAQQGATSRRLSNPTTEAAWRGCPTRKHLRICSCAGVPSSLRCHNGGRTLRAACSEKKPGPKVLHGGLRGAGAELESRSVGSSATGMASSMNSGRRFSTPMRGRSSVASTDAGGRCFHGDAEFVQRAPNCLCSLASVLSVRKPHQEAFATRCRILARWLLRAAYGRPSGLRRWSEQIG